jgi:hypothetical protein
VKQISSSDAFLLLQGWFEKGLTLFVNTFKTDGEHRAFSAQISEVLPKSQTLMARSGDVEVALPLAGANFLLLDERDTDKPNERELFLQCDLPSGNRVIFAVPEQ